MSIAQVHHHASLLSLSTPAQGARRHGSLQGRSQDSLRFPTWAPAAPPLFPGPSAQLQVGIPSTRPRLSTASKADPLRTTLPDGSIAQLKSVEHLETFWMLWRYFMPLHMFEVPGGEEVRWAQRQASPLEIPPYPFVRLQLHAKPLEAVSKASLAKGTLAPLIAEMKRLALSLPCPCLAAPQVGAALSLLVLGAPGGACKVLANPHVVMSAPFHNKQPYQCASLPGFELHIKRPSWLVVRALDEQGKEVLHTVHGAEAHWLGAGLDVLRGQLPWDHLDFREHPTLPSHLHHLERLAAATPCMANGWTAQLRGALSLREPSVRDSEAETANKVDPPHMHDGSCFAAYHESGHALLALLMPGSTCRGVSLRAVQPGQWEGATEVEWVPSDEDPYARTVRQIAVWLGGLAAEELMFGRGDLYGSPTGCAGFGDDLVAVAQTALSLAEDIRASQRFVLEKATSSECHSDAYSTASDNLGHEEVQLSRVHELAGCMADHWTEWQGRGPRRRLALPFCGAGDSLVLQLVDIGYEVAALSLSRNMRWLQAVAVGLMERKSLSEADMLELLNQEEAKQGLTKG